ncbi:MAG: hypothetical protein PHO02_05085 [Candidatus Nanoarchaeia archaeon]|nr:hypothetical protein [Candidatus Nanoarchaeia archaeon]
MEETASRTLVVIMVATLFIALFGTVATMNKFGGFKAITGAWDQGTTTHGAVNLTISSNLVINFTDDTASFGQGNVKSGATSCTMGTDGTNTSGCSGFTIPNGLMLENIGNRLASIKISNTNYTSSLLYDSTGLSGYAWKFENLSNDATCIGGNFTPGGGSGMYGVWGQYQNITATYSNTVNWTLCDVFNKTDGSDKINLSFKLHITPTTRAATGVGLSDTWTVVAADAES